MSLSERIRPGVEVAPWVIDEIKALEQERDALRQALQGLLDALPSATTHPAIKAARAAIARATGEQP
jgi:hypothetical protein